MNMDQLPDLLVGVSEADIQLEVPDMEQARRARRERTHDVMKALNPAVTREVLPETDVRTTEDKAATTIQAHYRGRLGRKQYIVELYNKFQQEEAMRLEKTLQQVEEGQLLVENHRLEVELDDNSTTRRNKTRQYLSDVITIQRAWRRYRQLVYGPGHTAAHYNMSPSPDESSPTDESSSASSSSSSSSSASYAHGHQAMSLCSPDDSTDSTSSNPEPLLNTDKTKYGHFIEPEPDSTVSDYSEMSDPIKEHLANVQIIQKEDLADGNICGPQVVNAQRIVREPDETDEEFAKRVRKINYLSLAQEFAALKKIDASAVPQDLHKKVKMSDSSATPETDSWDGGDSTPQDDTDMDQVTNKLNGANLTSWPVQNRNLVDGVKSNSQGYPETQDKRDLVLGDFDVYNIETTLPQMDWDLLEEQLHRAAEEEREKKESRRNDREEIRRKLAMAGPDEEYYGGERMYKKPNLQTRLQGGMNLQICFMNQATAEQDRGGGEGNSQGRVAEGEQTTARMATANEQQPSDTNPTSTSSDKVYPPGIGSSEDDTDEDFFTKQARLQAEARMALAQVRPMAHMQLEVEKQMRKKSPIAEVVQTGIPGFGDGKRRKLRHQLLGQMNLAQLQVVVNDLHAQIEGLNEELVRMLVERDDLHMEQDSMLVDIEDLTRRTQETKLFPQS